MNNPEERIVVLACAGGKVRVRAIAKKGGLALHRSWGWEDGYTITHVASGLVVIEGIVGLERARKAMKQLLKVGDWTRPKELILKDEAAKDAASDLS